MNLNPDTCTDADVRRFVATAIEVAHGTRDVLLATLDAAEAAHRELVHGDIEAARESLAALLEASRAFRVKQAIVAARGDA